MGRQTESGERRSVRIKWAAWIGTGIVLTLSVLLAVVSGVSGRNRVEIDLSQYVNVGTDAGGNPAVLLDVDAILNDLHLPNPNRPGVRAEDYPDVLALCSAKMHLSRLDEDHMRVTIEADTDTLARYGITFKALSWEQQVKGFVEGATPTPIPTLSPATPTPDSSPRETEPDGYLNSLLDPDGNGRNLRSVCETVQSERDSLCEEILGGSFDTTKTQTAFVVLDGGRHHNLYRASYTATTRAEDGQKPVTVWFTVDVYDLYLLDGQIGFGLVDVTIAGSEEESKALPSGTHTERLWGGGVKVDGKNGFDQNGFVRFFDCPTSFRLANGVYWSPTYDALTEDMVWGLTAVEGHSLANLLRYARKEIYARYYVAFDPKTEREFNEHYRAYDWYEPRDPDWEPRMTETERSNIRLLREIQSLIEK